jgi:PTS system fructose-specific IIB component
MKLVGVTSCPTGIAHSQMAAESLEGTANQLNHDIHVEIQGAMGAENELPQDAIESADAAIIAADTSVSQDRFEAADVPIVKGTVKDAINDTESLFDRAGEIADGTESETEATAEADTTESPSESGESDDQSDAGTRVGPNDVDADQIGGDPQKGLFARLRRMFS